MSDTWSRLRNRNRKAEFRQIEKKLHPVPIIDGVKICHEHKKSGSIIFSAWKDNQQINQRGVEMERLFVLYWAGEGYPLSQEDTDWLLGKVNTGEEKRNVYWGPD